MHILIGLALVVLLWLVLSRPAAARRTATGSPAAEAAAPTQPIAFVARGKLFHAGPGAPLREIHSPHVQAIADRLERSRQLHGWKKDTAFGVAAYGRERGGPGTELAIQAVSAQFLGAGRLLYVLRDDTVGGLFVQDLDSGREQRLLHRQNLLLDDLRVSADGSRLLCTQHSPTGTANIVGMDIEGNDFRELTGGDTEDTAPAWVTGTPGQVVFQSAGLARDPQGFVVARSPASIQLLDVATGSLTPVREDSRFDYLQPRVAGDGSLLFIRRPYERPRLRGADLLLDALLFPFRLLRALFHYLNFFSLMYSRKPLTSASGPQVQADLRDLLLKGRRVDTEAALRRGDRVNGVPSLVPSNWQLVRLSQQGEERVLATHVASFDLAADGGIVYSNGYGVFALDADGGSRVLLRDRLIAEIVAG